MFYKPTQGQSEAAFVLLEKISDECMGEQQYFWLTGLRQIAEGEAHVSRCNKQVERGGNEQECLERGGSQQECLERGVCEAMKCFNQAVFTIMVGFFSFLFISSWSLHSKWRVTFSKLKFKRVEGSLDCWAFI